MDTLRVLHVVPYYEDAWAYGGIPRAVTALARALARRGHRVAVATTDAGTARARASAPPVRESGGVEVRTFPNLSNALAYRLQMFLPLGLARYLSRHARDFDVAHVHACHNVPAVLAARALTRAGVPWVLSPHGTAALIERRRLAKRVFDLALGRRVRRDAAAITALTGVERRQLSALGVPASRLHVVPAALDPDEHADAAGRAVPHARAPGAGPVVTFLGTLTPRKRLDALIRAFAALDDPRARLVIAGNDMGAGRAARRLVADLGVSSRVRFTGLVAGPGRLALLAEADVVACASEHESFGLVALEALLAGTPVVVADETGCAEAIREVGGGLVVPAGDATALARAIRTIVADADAWRAAARSAADRVRERYAPARIARETEAVYEHVLGRDPAIRDAPASLVAWRA